MLRAYLQYAASGGENLGEVAMDKPALNPFEISVRDRLVAVGIPLTAQYGVAGYWIDFVAAHPTQPGRMVLAVEADGATYHSSDTARDRDRLRQEQLERLGWTFHRIWSTDWFHDSDACVAKVRVAYDKAVAAADAADTKAPLLKHQPTPMTTPTTAKVTRTPAHCPVSGGRTIVDYSTPDLISVLAWIESDTLLRTEEELYDEFRDALSFQRRGSRIEAAFDRALSVHRASRR